MTSDSEAEPNVREPLKPTEGSRQVRMMIMVDVPAIKKIEAMTCVMYEVNRNIAEVIKESALPK